MRVVVKEKSAVLIRMQLFDELLIPVGDDVISAIALTLFAKTSGDILNNRDAADVLNTNGGTLTTSLSVEDVRCTNPVVVQTATSHGLKTGDQVHVSDIVGPTQLNGRVFTVQRISDTEVALRGENGLAYDAYVSGGALKIGLFVQQLLHTDNYIVGDIDVGKKETHVAMFTVTAGAASVNEEVEFDVQQLAKVT